MLDTCLPYILVVLVVCLLSVIMSSVFGGQDSPKVFSFIVINESSGAARLELILRRARSFGFANEMCTWSDE